MTTEKTITGKIKELNYRVLQNTADKDPCNHLKWLLKNNGIEIIDDERFKRLVNKVFEEYNVTKDKKSFNNLFEEIVGETFRVFLNDCLGGEIE